MIDAEGGLGDRRSIVLAREGWHAGVIGIVASRLADMFHRPAIVISLGPEVSQGSARSIPGFDVYQAIKECSDRLLAFGGHPAAAGLKLRQDQLADFTRRFEESCRATLASRAARARARDRRRGPAGRPDASRRRGDREARAARHRQSQAAACWPPTSRSPARRGRSAPRNSTSSSASSKAPHELKAIGWNMAAKAQFARPGLALLGGLPPVDQRMEQPPRRPA